MDVAFASSDLETSFITELAAGGTYAVEGVNEGAGIYLADTVTIDPDGRNDFEIPLAQDGDSGSAQSGLGDDVAFVCTKTPAGCPVSHAASGISLTLPNDWSMSEPYFYETAGGAGSGLPTVTFFWERFGTVNTIELNPRQWLESNGRCAPVGTSQLCYMSEQDMMLHVVFEMILDTLSVTPLAGDIASIDAPHSGAVYPIDLSNTTPEALRRLLSN
ncbi:MAG: hypothetical protein ABS76_07780 [Pelagibacterium sp. SCN 64-44]|nr:MAG: hypothetical protein ABS76_07780 [Pelagibacterium sp. SCN 64-44]